MTMMDDRPIDLMNIKVKVTVDGVSCSVARAAELSDLIRSYIDKTMENVEAHLRSLYEPHLVIKVEE